MTTPNLVLLYFFFNETNINHNKIIKANNKKHGVKNAGERETAEITEPLEIKMKVPTKSIPYNTVAIIEKARLNLYLL